MATGSCVFLDLLDAIQFPALEIVKNLKLHEHVNCGIGYLFGRPTLFVKK
jgi:hypothetical protein